MIWGRYPAPGLYDKNLNNLQQIKLAKAPSSPLPPKATRTSRSKVNGPVLSRRSSKVCRSGT